MKYRDETIGVGTIIIWSAMMVTMDYRPAWALCGTLALGVVVWVAVHGIAGALYQISYWAGTAARWEEERLVRRITKARQRWQAERETIDPLPVVTGPWGQATYHPPDLPTLTGRPATTKDYFMAERKGR